MIPKLCCMCISSSMKRVCLVVLRVAMRFCVTNGEVNDVNIHLAVRTSKVVPFTSQTFACNVKALQRRTTTNSSRKVLHACKHVCQYDTFIQLQSGWSADGMAKPKRIRNISSSQPQSSPICKCCNTPCSTPVGRQGPDGEHNALECAWTGISIAPLGDRVHSTRHSHVNRNLDIP